MKNKLILAFTGFTILSSVLLAGSAFAMGMHQGGRFGMRPGISGTVASINGSALTVTSKPNPRNSSSVSTTYTVDATNAKITKNGTSSSVSAIAAGDLIFVQGTVNGTNVTATAIRDGIMTKGNRPNNAVLQIQGNGQPVVGGAVTVINGASLTITNKSNVNYTVDATNATITKNGTASSLSNISVGDNIIVQGTVNGSSITASSIIDQGATTSNVTPNTANNGQNTGHRFMGEFFGGIGGFFKHLFGFF